MPQKLTPCASQRHRVSSRHCQRFLSSTGAYKRNKVQTSYASKSHKSPNTAGFLQDFLIVLWKTRGPDP